MMVFTVIGMITGATVASLALAVLWNLTVAGHLNRPKRLDFDRLAYVLQTPRPDHRFYRIIGWDSLNFYVIFKRKGKTRDTPTPQDA